MKKNLLILSTAIIFLFTSCGPGTLSLKEFPHNTDYEVIDLNEAFKSDEYWNFNEVFKSEEPMIFEEDKDNPLSYDFCGAANDNIYLLNSYYNGYILVYNMQGKFIKRLTDPDTGELINNIRNLYVDNFNNTLLIQSDKNSSLYEVRSLDGKLIKTYDDYYGYGLIKKAQCGYIRYQSSNYTNHKYTTRNDYHYYFTSYDKNFKEIGTYYSNLASDIDLHNLQFTTSNYENTYFGVCYDNHVYSLDSTGIIKAKYYLEFSDYEIHLDEGTFPGKYCFSGQFVEVGNWQFFQFRTSGSHLYRAFLIARNKKTGIAKKFKFDLFWFSDLICYKNTFYYEHKKYTLQD